MSSVQLSAASNSTDGKLPLAVRYAKTGARTTSVLSKKAFAELHPEIEGSAALNKAHFEYKRKAMGEQTIDLGGALASGRLLCQSVQVSADGTKFRPVLVLAGSVTAPVPKLTKAERKLAVETIRTLLVAGALTDEITAAFTSRGWPVQAIRDEIDAEAEDVQADEVAGELVAGVEA